METGPAATEEPDWPQECPECGTELQTAHVPMPAGDDVDTPDFPVVRDFCPNPECPQHDADIAASVSEDDADGADGADEREIPGSLGGDSGGG